MNENKEYTERRGSLMILSITILLIILIVVLGVTSQFMLEKTDANVILLCLIGMLIAVAVASFIFIEMQRRQAQRKRDVGASELVRQIYEQQKHQESIPELGNTDGSTATWALTKPWRYSQRSTLRV
ncbi:PREDICTED: uncharacterized protein LOC108565524 [Nicrophorus vespilloides]|uniref:Uncharacterized protein LOC108565524 n=1 Tax=Nicrophorus vespilloides TaxID=110193 RepID=A0ABM1N127_NICVS|nr:PREDICTED: uncharacterized protein LOC108565524 [Nicrophorus vespilloides]